MSETIERLDYTKAPPGYNIVSDVDGYLFRDKGGNMYRSAGHHLGGDWRKDVALVKAWSHYKREHDPPGMMVEEVESEAPEIDGWGFTVGNQQWSADWNKVEARAAAWTWHDRRHTLAERDKALHPNVKAAFADYLAMSDADCDLAEKILTNDERRAAARGGCCVGNATALAALDRAITRLEEVGALIEAHARDKAAQGRYADS